MRVILGGMEFGRRLDETQSCEMIEFFLNKGKKYKLNFFSEIHWFFRFFFVFFFGDIITIDTITFI